MKKPASFVVLLIMIVGILACRAGAPAPTVTPAPTNTPRPTATPTKMPMTVGNVEDSLNAQGYQFLWDPGSQIAVDRSGPGFWLALVSDDGTRAGQLGSIELMFDGMSTAPSNSGTAFGNLALALGVPRSMLPLIGQTFGDLHAQAVYSGFGVGSQDVQGWITSVSVDISSGFTVWALGHGTNDFGLLGISENSGPNGE